MSDLGLQNSDLEILSAKSMRYCSDRDIVWAIEEYPVIKHAIHQRSVGAMAASLVGLGPAWLPAVVASGECRERRGTPGGRSDTPPASGR